MTRVSVSLSLAACLFSGTAFAQTTPVVNVISIGREVIKEGRAAAHERVEADWARTERRIKSPAYYVALNSQSEPEVWFVSGYPSFKAIEENSSFMDKAPIKAEMELLDARDGELRASSHGMTAIFRPDLSYHADRVQIGKAKAWMLTSVRVRIGRENDFAQGWKMFTAAYDKINWPFSSVCYQVIAGAPDGTYLIWVPLESMARIDEFGPLEPKLMEAMGPNFSTMMKAAGELFASMDTTLFRVSPIMSYVSKETEDQDQAFWRPKMPAKPAAEAKPNEKTGQ